MRSPCSGKPTRRRIYACWSTARSAWPNLPATAYWWRRPPVRPPIISPSRGRSSRSGRRCSRSLRSARSGPAVGAARSCPTPPSSPSKCWRPTSAPSPPPPITRRCASSTPSRPAWSIGSPCGCCSTRGTISTNGYCASSSGFDFTAGEAARSSFGKASTPPFLVFADWHTKKRHPVIAGCRGRQPTVAALLRRHHGFEIGLFAVVAVAARERRATDADLLERCHKGLRILALGGWGARIPQVGDPHDVVLHHMADQHAVHMWIGDVVEPDLGVIILQDHLVLDLLDLNLLRMLLQLVRHQRASVLEVLLEIGLVGRRHDDGRAFGRVGAHAAGVIHMVVRQDQILDRLAGIFLLGHLDHGLRLDLAKRRVEDRKPVLHVHDQVVGAGDRLLHIGSKLGELGRRI